MNIDLHSHSTFSDGSLTPEMLAQRMCEAGINAFALTDHDTVAGVPWAQAAATTLGITCIAGVEISCRSLALDVHMVGLNVDTGNALLVEGLSQQYDRRWARAQKICQRLQKSGCPAIFDSACNIASQSGDEAHSARVEGRPSPPGRPHIAKALVAAGVVKDENQAFQKYLAIGKSAFVATEWPSLEEAANWIRQAGGIPVLAHPLHYKLTRTKLERLISHFAESGGLAVEVVSPNQDPLQRRMLAGFCEKYGLCGSVASDFHGYSVPWIKLGKLDPLPHNVRSVMSLMPGIEPRQPPQSKVADA